MYSTQEFNLYNTACKKRTSLAARLSPPICIRNESAFAVTNAGSRDQIFTGDERVHSLPLSRVMRTHLSTMGGSRPAAAERSEMH